MQYVNNHTTCCEVKQYCTKQWRTIWSDAGGEFFIKLICRERFSTDLVRHLINPTTDGGEDDNNDYDDDDDDDDDGDYDDYDLYAAEHLLIIVRKVWFHFPSRTKIDKTITDGGSTAPQNFCYQS